MKRRVFWLGVILTSVLTAFYIGLSFQKNDGNLIYPVDDAYIHMAIAKNFATKMVWGVTSYEFTSSTSSPIYTFLLSICFFLFGQSVLYPVLLNYLFALLLLSFLYSFAQEHWDDITYGIVSLLIIILTPLHIIILSGMEHTLHILVLLVLLKKVYEAIETEERKHLSFTLAICSLSSLAILTRYESIFILTLFSVVLIYNRKYRMGLAVFLSAALPIIIYGSISLYNGAFFLPNSLLIKATIPSFSLIGLGVLASKAYKSFFIEAPHIGFLVLILLATIYVQCERSIKFPTSFFSSVWIQIILIIAAISHLIFGKTGWFFRYEAYLIAVGVLAASPLIYFLRFRIKEFSREKLAVIAVVLGICITPLLYRVAATFYTAQYASNNIFEQQIQMSRFLHQFYDTSSIAANDIGAIVYFSNVHLLDLVGLGSNEVIKNKNLSKRELIEFYGEKNGIQFAILYENIFSDAIPPDWIKVAEWTIDNNRICASETVSFFARNCTSYYPLVKRLKSFDLDSDVKERFFEKDIEYTCD